MRKAKFKHFLAHDFKGQHGGPLKGSAPQQYCHYVSAAERDLAADADFLDFSEAGFESIARTLSAGPSGWKSGWGSALKAYAQFLRVHPADTIPPDSSSEVQEAKGDVLRLVKQRQGQPAFRSALLKAYAGRCAISGCDIVEALEAAHIYPYSSSGSHETSNGLLLRADLHTLFDQGYLGITPDSLTVWIDGRLQQSEYAMFDGNSLRLPDLKADHPSREALERHWSWRRSQRLPVFPQRKGAVVTLQTVNELQEHLF